MGRTANLSTLGLYNWDNTIFDLMQIPTGLNRETLVMNILAETSELEVLYPNPVVFKNLVGLWSRKEIDVWNKLYETTQYEYNPIENYNRYETSTEEREGTTTHSGTDTTTDTTTDSATGSGTRSVTHGGTDERTEEIEHGGSDSTATSTEFDGSDTIVKDYGEGGTQTDNQTITKADGGTQSEAGTSGKTFGGTDEVERTHHIEYGGTDETEVAGMNRHFIAGFNSYPTQNDDGLVPQTRDENSSTTTLTYGKTEDGTGDETTTYGKTEAGTSSNTVTFGKTENNTDNMTHTFGKTIDETNTTTYGKEENSTETKTYGGTESTTETKTYGETENTTTSDTLSKTGSKTSELEHGEQIDTNGTTGIDMHAHGNIGVTTTQNMIRQERDIDRFNLYDIIIESFKMRFCILIY